MKKVFVFFAKNKIKKDNAYENKFKTRLHDGCYAGQIHAY